MTGLYFEHSYLCCSASVYQVKLTTAAASELQYYSKIGHPPIESEKKLTGYIITKSEVVLDGNYIFNYRSESN